MRSNELKRLLRESRVLLGGSLSFPSPDVLEIMGHGGFDFAVLDTEHGSYGMEAELANLLRACEVSGLSSLVRITENDPARILKALDAGAQGVLVPRICTREDVEKALGAAKYSPLGNRGCCGNTRATRHSAIPGPEYYPLANRETMVALLIEEAEAVERIEEVLAPEGIDLLWLGPSDLSASMGYAGQAKHPAVVAALERVTEVAHRRGIPVAAAAALNDAAQMQFWLDRGVHTFILSVTRTIFLSFKELAAKAAKMVAAGAPRD